MILDGEGEGEREKRKKKRFQERSKRYVQIQRARDIVFVYNFKGNPYNKNTNLSKSQRSYIKKSKRNKKLMGKQSKMT